jgi:hypothetical protein
VIESGFHCYGASWQGGVVNIHGRGADGEPRSLLVAEGDEIALAADGPRRCIGATPPGIKHRQPCPTAEIIPGGDQCPACQQTSNLLSCMICTGERCANRMRRLDCVQPQNHAVYLASWSPGIVKVGVARWERRYERLAEQGARAALIVGRADGKEARLLESHIKWLGTGRRKRGEDAGSGHRHRRDTQAVDDRLRPAEKLAAWCEPALTAPLEEELHQRLSLLHRRLPSAVWLAEPEPVSLPPLPQLNLRPRLLHADGLRLRGRLVGCYGRILIIEDDLDELVALSPEKLASFTLRPLGADEHAQEQISLAI